MDEQKYNRRVHVICPTCGGESFSSESANFELAKCENCGLELTKSDLISGNQENISAHTEEIKKLVLKDMKKQLQKSLADAFRGNKNIKIR